MLFISGTLANWLKNMFKYSIIYIFNQQQWPCLHSSKQKKKGYQMNKSTHTHTFDIFSNGIFLLLFVCSLSLSLSYTCDVTSIIEQFFNFIFLSNFINKNKFSFIEFMNCMFLVVLFFYCYVNDNFWIIYLSSHKANLLIICDDTIFETCFENWIKYYR